MRVIEIDNLTYRAIDPEVDADLAVRNHHDACVASFGNDCRYEGRHPYLRYLREQVAVYPDGSVLALEGGRCVGQLELRVPYGLPVGYVNLFYVAAAFRGRGYGRRLHAYAEQYFRAWEANRIELHVSPTNERAVEFYRSMGYEFVAASENPDDPRAALWKMAKTLAAGP